MHSVRGILLLQYHRFAGLPEAASLLRTLDTTPCTEGQLQLLDILLMQECGIVLSYRLREELRKMTGAELGFLRDWIVQVYKSAQILPPEGAVMDPLNGNFPDNVPENMVDFWASRFLSLFQEKDGVCLTCGKVGTTHVLEPCHHVVCGECFAGYTGCPVCGHAVAADSPFLKDAANTMTPDDAARTKAVLIDFCPDLEAFAREAFLRICRTTGSLDIEKNEELAAYILEYSQKIADWLPKNIASREAKARIVATCLQMDDRPSELDSLVRYYLQTATDVLRLLAILSGQDGSLLPVQKRRMKTYTTAEELQKAGSNAERRAILERRLKSGITTWKEPESYLSRRFRLATFDRSSRRCIMGLLDSFERDALIEDMLRHRDAWIGVGEKLHPGDYAKQYPKVAEAFRILRRKDRDGTPAPRFVTWNAKLRRAIDEVDTRLLEILMEWRPGEYCRHLDEIMRNFGRATGKKKEKWLQNEQAEDSKLQKIFEASDKTFESPLMRGIVKMAIGGVANLLNSALGSLKGSVGRDNQRSNFNQVAPRLDIAMLMHLFGHLRARRKTLPARVFMPAGYTHRVYCTKDERRPLGKMETFLMRNDCEREIVKRLGDKPHFDTAIIDESLIDVPAPHCIRASAGLPIGAFLRIPGVDEGTVRLFLHWCEKEGAEDSDLDLSVGFFNEAWELLDECAYYQLAGNYAKHSGDFQEAPWPRGASEYVDIDRAAALAGGARYAAMLVNVYRGVDFSQLDRAFAGVMIRRDLQAQAFDPLTVRYRFPLSGKAGASLPCIFDLKEGSMFCLYDNWAGGAGANLKSLAKHIAMTAKHAMAYYRAQPRTTRFELAALHALARTRHILVRGGSDVFSLDNDPASPVQISTITSLRALPDFMRGDGFRTWKSLPKLTSPVLAFLCADDIALPEGSEGYAVFSGGAGTSSDWTALMS